MIGKLFHNLSKKNKETFEIQLEKLMQAGLKINPNFDKSVIEDAVRNKSYEGYSYKDLLIELGDLWRLNTECIEKTGDYVWVMRKLVDMAQGDLPLKNISDVVDYDYKIALVKFFLNGKEYKFNLKVDDDWLDMRLFSMVNQLLLNCNGKRQFAILVLDQTILIGFFQEEQVKKINKLCSLKFVIV
jgi:hypothetical protein